MRRDVESAERVACHLKGTAATDVALFVQQGREMPSFCILFCRVDRFIPSRAAAPVGPPTTQAPPGGNTPIPQPPQSGTPGEFIPVTGIDLGGSSALNARLLQNLGLGLVGLALVLHGISLSRVMCVKGAVIQ